MNKSPWSTGATWFISLFRRRNQFVSSRASLTERLIHSLSVEFLAVENKEPFQRPCLEILYNVPRSKVGLLRLNDETGSLKEVKLAS